MEWETPAHPKAIHKVQGTCIRPALHSRGQGQCLPPPVMGRWGGEVPTLGLQALCRAITCSLWSPSPSLPQDVFPLPSLCSSSHAPSPKGHSLQVLCMGTPMISFSRGRPPASAPPSAGVTVPWTLCGTYTGHGKGVGITRVRLCTASPDSSKAQSPPRSLKGKCGGAEIFSTSHFSVLSEGQGCIFSKAEK